MPARTYRINIAAEMSGLSEGLIRAWERRYGVPRPARTASGYRTYSKADIELLKRLKRLTEEGISIAEAAQQAPRLRRELKAEATGGEPARAPTGLQVQRWKAEIFVAAEALDQVEVERVLDEAWAALPAVALTDALLLPVQAEVGERWHAGRMSVAEEHLVTQAVRQRVLSLLQVAPRRAKAHVVCACFPLEEHELGLVGAALRFRHAGWRVTFLGARVPPEHLARVVARTQPDLVALSAINDEGRHDFETTLAAMVQAAGKVPVLLGGLAAHTHAEVVARSGCLTAWTPQAWDAVLSAPTP